MFNVALARQPLRAKATLTTQQKQRPLNIRQQCTLHSINIRNRNKQYLLKNKHYLSDKILAKTTNML